MGWMTKTICRVSWPKRKRVCGCSPWFYFCSMSLLEEGGLGQWSRQIPVNGFDLLTQLTEGNLQKTGVPEFTAKEAMKKIELSLELGRPTSFWCFLVSFLFNGVPFFGTRSGDSGGHGNTNPSKIKNEQESIPKIPKISDLLKVFCGHSQVASGSLGTSRAPSQRTCLGHRCWDWHQRPVAEKLRCQDWLIFGTIVVQPHVQILPSKTGFDHQQ